MYSLVEYRLWLCSEKQRAFEVVAVARRSNRGMMPTDDAPRR